MKFFIRLKTILTFLSWMAMLTSTAGLSDFSVSSFLDQNVPGGPRPSNPSDFRSVIPGYMPLVGTRHDACKAEGKTGVCMFSWECVNAGGTPLGVCKQGFSYGACCTTPSYISPSIKVKVEANGVLKPVSYGTHQCGVTSNMFIRRGHIYNGEDSQFGEFPWMVSMRRVSLKVDTIHWCGGALLNTEWILSAAHCFHRVHPTNIIARLGELDFKNPNKQFPFVERRIGKKFQHPKYLKTASGVSDYDITILKMDKAIRFQPHISPVCLPPLNSYITEGDAIVTGWGKTENETGSHLLQKVIVPVLPNSECKAMMVEEGYDAEFSNKLFCAGYAKGQKDACQGDSGSPLQMKGDNGQYFLVGVVSTGIGCAKPNFPGIYLRISPFLSWTLETMSKH